MPVTLMGLLVPTFLAPVPVKAAVCVVLSASTEKTPELLRLSVTVALLVPS